MRPLWQATHAVVAKVESDPEFARFVHVSEKIFKRSAFSECEKDEPVESVYRSTGYPDWAIRIAASWDRSKVTICFSWEEIDDE